MMRQALVKPTSIKTILLLQFIPLILFPPSAFSLASQEWWLPVLLAILAIVAVVQLFRHSYALWPWYLVGFAQGFNIISRLMMLMPHATLNEGGQIIYDIPYIGLTLLAIVLSGVLLWYTELPEVRLGLIRD
jgi:hypothetical protein